MEIVNEEGQAFRGLVRAAVAVIEERRRGDAFELGPPPTTTSSPLAVLASAIEATGVTQLVTTTAATAITGAVSNNFLLDRIGTFRYICLGSFCTLYSACPVYIKIP